MTTTSDYLRKKYGRQAIGDAREEDDLSTMNPEELIPFPSRRVFPADEAPPLLEAEPERDEVMEGRDLDLEARSRANYTNASKDIASAISGFKFKSDYANPDVSNEDRAAKRKQDLQNYLLQKNRGDTNAMNAQAALNNSTRERAVTPPKPEKIDPLLEDKRGLIHAQTKKALHVPAAKPVKPAKSLNGGLPEGYEASPTHPPSEDNRKRFTARVDNREKMLGLTNQMREALKEASGFGKSLPGSVRTKIAGLAGQIQIETKNVAELGALSGPDMGLVEGIIADPTNISNLLKDIPGQLDGLDRWAENGVQSGLKAYGVRKQGAGGEASELPKVASEDDFAKLASGTEFIDPNGKKRRKP